MEKTQTRVEAERWLGVAQKLLEARDLLGSKRFAKRAQETDPKVDGADQIVAIIDVLLAAEKRINNHLDWYAILQFGDSDRGRSTNDLELIKRQYRKLALLLHPDKNKSPFSDNAFKLVCDAWAFLSDPTKKSLYDNEFNLFMRFDPIVLKKSQTHQVAPLRKAAPPRKPLSQTPVRRSVREKKKSEKAVAAEEEEEDVVEIEKPSRLSTFWTLCPYCYHLYEYPRVYEDCCLRCQKCRRSFHAAVVPSPPPAVGPGKDLYYCCWAFFPIGYTTPGNVGKNPKWTPFASMFPQPGQVEKGNKVTLSSDSDSKDDVENVRGGKKVKTGNVMNHVLMNKSRVNVQAEKANGNKFEGANVGNSKSVQDGFGANNVDPSKTVRIKTTARKSIRPKPSNQTVVETCNKVVGGRSDPQWLGMDLNLEVKPEAEEPRMAGAVEGMEIGSIDKEATEGIGFFEGLDDILGNLPLLSVPGDKKGENAS